MGGCPGARVGDCMSAIVNISFRCLTPLGLLSKVDSDVKFLDQDFRGNVLPLQDAVQANLGTNPLQ